MSVLSDASSPPYPLNSVISRHDLNLRRQQLQQQPERPHHEPGTLAAFLGSSRHPSLSAGFAEHKSAGQHPALMQPPSQLASGYGFTRREPPHRSCPAARCRPEPAVRAVEPSVYAQRHARDQFGLLQRQEQELTRVRGFLEQQLAKQNEELARLRGSLVGSPPTEAALRHAVDQNRLSERAALQSGQFRPLPAVDPSVYAQRHTCDQFGLLQRQEQELTRVRGFLEQQLAKQNEELARLRGSLVGSPRTEAALRHAVDQNRLSERAALQSGQFRPLPAVEPSVYAQRHTRDQFGLLQRQEQELTRVRGFLEQQLAKQNEELARLRVGHEQQLQSVERLHGELMERWQRDPSETKDDEIRRVRIDHAHQVACIKSRQASEMWQLQNHIMHLMQIQQEELERVQALHGQQIRAQNEEQAAELSRIGVVPEGRGISHPIAADPAMQHAFLTQEADNRALQLHAHNEVARMLAEQRTKEGAAVSLLTEREQEIARLQHETVEQMQKVQLESEELKRQQELEMKKLHTIQASKLHDYQSVLRRLGQVEPATDAR
ncbi:hypothetical protein DIPPA_25165, partial [Diplonema papillatum]